jgi:hypothetical protein
MLNSIILYLHKGKLLIVIRTPKGFGRIQVKVKGYLNENWGYPFIAGFMVLLCCAAIFLAAGWTSLADATAICAYFALATGVFLQFTCLSKNRRKKEEAILDESS